MSLNCGVFGLKKLRGCGSKVTASAGLAMRAPHLQRGGDHRAVAEMDAVEIAHRNHRPPRDRGARAWYRG